MTEINLTCVLDFYVHESAQRGGHGKAIYDFMLAKEGAEPESLGIDRPSSKFLGFMKKYFNLSRYLSQNSHFVIFDRFFERNRPNPKTKTIEAVKKKPLTVNTNMYGNKTVKEDYVLL